MVQDEEAEKKWNFLLKLSLSNASKTKLLDGYNVFATSSVLPSPKDLKGTVLVIFLCSSFRYMYVINVIFLTLWRKYHSTLLTLEIGL